MICAGILLIGGQWLDRWHMHGDIDKILGIFMHLHSMRGMGDME